MKSRIVAACAGLACVCALLLPMLAQGSPLASRAEGEALLAASPEDGRNYLAYAQWLVAAGEMQEAAAVLEAGCRRAEEPAPLLLELAGLSRRLGRLARAEALAREALVLLPESADAHLCMGDVYLALGWPQSAIESYEQAVGLAPGRSEPRTRLVAGLVEAGLVARAEDTCLGFIAATADDPQLWLALGAVFERQDKLREAFTTYGQVLSLVPDSAEALARQGRLFCRFGQYSSAADACRRALTMDEGNLVAHAYLGIACSYLGQGDEARHHAQIAEAGGLNMTAVWKKLN